MKKLWIVAGAAVIAAFLLSKYCVQLVRVNGSSMEPTYHDGQLLVMNRLDKEYEKGDVIVFHNDHYGRYLIKRVYALPGEAVDTAGVEGGLFTDIPVVTLGEDEYYVLGDNRDNSRDSRDEYIGAVKREDILGSIIGGSR